MPYLQTGRNPGGVFTRANWARNITGRYLNNYITLPAGRQVVA